MSVSSGTGQRTKGRKTVVILKALNLPSLERRRLMADLILRRKKYLHTLNLTRAIILCLETNVTLLHEVIDTKLQFVTVAVTLEKFLQ